MYLHKAIYKKMVKETENSTYRIVPFGILAFFSFLIFYIININNAHVVYESFSLRLIAALFCFPLILKKYWPKKIQSLLPVYWYLTLLYTLPFFFSFMFLKNHGSTTWLVNISVLLVFLALLVDWLSFIVLLILGVGLGALCYFLTTQNLYMPEFYNSTLTALIIAVFVGGIFSRSREKAHEERLLSMKMTAGLMAHELKTPLLTIRLLGQRLKNWMPVLFKNYHAAKQQQLDTPNISETKCEELKIIGDDIDFEVSTCFASLNLLWANVNEPRLTPAQLSRLSMKQVIEKILAEYPFHHDEQAMLNLNPDHNFEFMGEIKNFGHVLFNLIHNALYFVRKANHPQITIWMEQHDKHNELHFKDNGAGISKKDLPHIFERFYTKREHGTGIGLAFCKVVMEELGGEICCDSKPSKYTEFVLSFPKIYPT